MDRKRGGNGGGERERERGGARGNERKETEKVANGSDRRAEGWRIIVEIGDGGNRVSVTLIKV